MTSHSNKRESLREYFYSEDAYATKGVGEPNGAELQPPTQLPSLATRTWNKCSEEIEKWKFPLAPISREHGTWTHEPAWTCENSVKIELGGSLDKLTPTPMLSVFSHPFRLLCIHPAKQNGWYMLLINTSLIVSCPRELPGHRCNDYGDNLQSSMNRYAVWRTGFCRQWSAFFFSSHSFEQK